MAKRTKANPAAENGYTVMAVAEPRKLSEVVTVMIRGNVDASHAKVTLARANLVKAIGTGYTYRGYLSSCMEELHKTAAAHRVWDRAAKIYDEKGSVEPVMRWAAEEHRRLINSQAWRHNSTSPWCNVATQEDAGAAIEALGDSWHDSVGSVCRYILDGLKDGSIIDDTADI